MKAKYLLLALACGLTAIAACKKKTTGTEDTNISIAGKTKQQVFMMQKWKIGTWTDSNSNIGLQDYNNDPCTTDDSYSFGSTSQYTLDRGTCTNGDPKTENFAWAMTSGNASVVTIFSADYTIVSQTTNAITLTRQHILSGYSTKETLVFGKF